MAFYDKSARIAFSVVLSVVIHAVLIGLLVSTQFFSDGTETQTPPAETPAPTPEPPTELPKEAPEGTKKNLPPHMEAKVSQEKVAKEKKSDKPAPLLTEPRDPFLPETPKAQKKVETADGTEIHVVKKGESLSSIARAYGCTLAELTRLNRNQLKRQKSLFVGAKLRVPKK